MKRLIGALAGLTLGFLGSASCWASTVVSYGDGSNSLDTTTGLLWLDVPLTYQMPRSSVLSQLGAGGLFEGYRYATSAEISQLWTDADIPNPYNGPATSAASAYEALIALLGPTFFVQWRIWILCFSDEQLTRRFGIIRDASGNI